MAGGALLVLLSMQVITTLGNPVVLSMASQYKSNVHKPTLEEQMEIAMLASKNEGQASHPGRQGEKRTELDIILTKEQEENSIGRRKKRNAITNSFNRWPTNTVPYEIDTNYFDASEEQTIIDSMNAWQAATCLTFRQKTTSDTDYVNVRQGDGGCYSYVGRIGGSQEMGLGSGCVFKEVVVHEFGHAIGLFHHQGRPDRDEFVDILYNNIASGLDDQFEKHSSTLVSTFDVTYDYRSVMHYGRRFFSKNGEDTIRTKDSFYQDIIGRAPTLSFRDAKIVNAMYNCANGAGCSTTPCPGEGYRGADCKCYCPENDGVNIIECAEPVTTAAPSTAEQTTSVVNPTTTEETVDDNTTPSNPTTSEDTVDETTTPFVEDTTPFDPMTTEDPVVEDTTPFDPMTTEDPFIEDTTPFDPMTTEDTFVEDTTPFDPMTTEEPFIDDTTPFDPMTTEDPFIEETTPFEPMTTEEPCGNIWSNRKCERMRNNGKCYRSRVVQNCRKTCGDCGPTADEFCSDEFPDLCPQLHFLCDSWELLRDSCHFTCGICNK